MKKFLITLGVALLLISCTNFDNQKRGNGNVTTENREVTENFTKIVVGQAIDVEIEQTNSYNIEVEADSNLQNHIKTTIENGVLKISSDVNIQNAEKLLVKVKMKQITEIETTSASSLKSVNILKGKTLRIAASSASDVDVEAEFENMHLEATSTGEINIKGKTLKLETSASSASEIDASELIANEVFAQATSASETSVHAIVKLDAKASSAGSITSVKKPKEIRKEETSGGEVLIE
jgi:hypothetical protein